MCDVNGRGGVVNTDLSYWVLRAKLQTHLKLTPLYLFVHHPPCDTVELVPVEQNLVVSLACEKLHHWRVRVEHLRSWCGW